MSNSPLVNYTKISPNRTSPRNHKIDTVTIHCVVGQLSVERVGEIFTPKSRQASSNYAVGADGRIGMYVEEKDRSWCSSSKSNDNRAVTIEVASGLNHPYAVRPNVYDSLLNLVTDICKRNGIKKLLWQADKSLIGKIDKQNMTVHRWFSKTACPGDYLFNKHYEIAAEVNKRLGVVETSMDFKPYQVRINVPSLNIRKGPGVNFDKNGVVNTKYLFTIVEESKGWGKVKSGAGWVNLGYVEKIN